MANEKEWGGSLHTSFRLLPRKDISDHLAVFMQSDGKTPSEVLEELAYDRARSGDGSKKKPDPKRYRDPRHLYEGLGLLYEGADGRVHLTRLGRAVGRWTDVVSEENFPVIGRHLANALSVCQLINPTGSGGKYDPGVEVFPYAFMWRAMLALDGVISSDELNRAIFKVSKADELNAAVESVRKARDAGDVDLMGPETITGSSKNDRIIPWVSRASFGWSLIMDKRESEGSGLYQIRPNCVEILRDASALQRPHREFGSIEEYASYISMHAGLPKDVRNG